jgi:hypothetical protein
VKNWQKTNGIEEKLDLKMVNELIYAIMLDAQIVAYIQFVIMLIELEKVLSQELKCLFV